MWQKYPTRLEPVFFFSFSFFFLPCFLLVKANQYAVEELKFEVLSVCGVLACLRACVLA